MLSCIRQHNLWKMPSHFIYYKNKKAKKRIFEFLIGAGLSIGLFILIIFLFFPKTNQYGHQQHKTSLSKP